MQQSLGFKVRQQSLPVKPVDAICKVCPYYKSPSVNSVCVPMRRATEKFDMERDGKNIRYLLVGEAPGANEDNEGLPFVGASGLLLENLLNKIIPDKLDQVGITNAVRCRPDKNKNPSVKSKRACVQYLQEEIKLLPHLQVIIVMGTQALSTLMPDVTGGVGANRLKILQWQGYPLLPTFHPAAVLYDKTKGPHLYDDLYAYLVQEIWRENREKEDSFPVEIVNDIRKVKEWEGEIKKAERIAIDIETIGFTNKILTIGTYIHEE